MATKSWMFMSESVNETFGGRFAPGSDTSDAAHVRLAAAPSSPVESVFLSALPLSSSLLRSGPMLLPPKKGSEREERSR